MKYKVLISAPYFQPVVHLYERFFKEHSIETFVPSVKERFEEEDLLKWIEDCDGVVCGDDRFTPKVIATAKKLKVISKWGTGIDSIDQEACKAKGITICNTPNAFTNPVTETVIGYALTFIRNIANLDRFMKKGIWQKVHGCTLSECTFGIVGVGNIGRELARKLRALGVGKILGQDIRAIPDAVIQSTGMIVVDLPTLLGQSDIVSLNCDLNPSSRHIINAKTLRMMKNSSFLINTARGPIVCEKDLCQALMEGWIAGAGLDVFEHEPLSHQSPLLKMDQVLLAPHNSNSSPVAWKRVHENTLNNLVQELKKHD